MTMDVRAVFDGPTLPRRYRFEELTSLYTEKGVMPAISPEEFCKLQKDKDSQRFDRSRDLNSN
jgi:hypothetical protein